MLCYIDSTAQNKQGLSSVAFMNLISHSRRPRHLPRPHPRCHY